MGWCCYFIWIWFHIFPGDEADDDEYEEFEEDEAEATGSSEHPAVQGNDDQYVVSWNPFEFLAGYMDRYIYCSRIVNVILAR